MSCTSIVLRNVPIEEIISRIASHTKKNSMVCCCAEKEAMMICITPSHLELSVNLWRQQESSSVEQSPISFIVELQRLHGCAIEMSRVQRDFFHALTRGEGSHQRAGNFKRKLFAEASGVNRTLSSKQARNADADAENTIDCLNIAMDLLQSIYQDQRQPGIETLCSLSCTATSSIDISALFRRSLIYGEGNYGCRLRDSLLPHLVTKNMGGAQTGIKNHGGVKECDTKYLSEAVDGTLQVFVNALAVATELVETNKRNLSKSDFRSEFWATAVDSLLCNVRFWSDCPHKAALSSRCLFLTLGLTDQVPCFVLDDGLLVSLTMAHDYGAKYHSNLEREATRLMKRLTSQ